MMTNCAQFSMQIAHVNSPKETQNYTIGTDIKHSNIKTN